MPYKIWSVNEILTAADMNDYVGNQTILSFAGTAARSSAIGTPVEGMLSYVGSGTVEVYAGTAGWTAISGGGGGGVVIGTAAPDTPAEGDLWWDSDNGKLYVYYEDVDSSQWVDAAGPSVAVQSTAPTGYEGQLWLDDTDGSMYVYYTDPGGSASSWIGAVSRSGGILQVVSTTKTNTFSTTSTSFVDVTGLSATITPRSTSSKILVFFQANISGDGTSYPQLRLMRDATAINVGDASGSRRQSTYAVYNGGTSTGVFYYGQSPANSNFLDSPNTTSSVTYKIQMTTQANTVYVNRSGEDPDTNQAGRTTSSITLIEVAG
jgi:hypothetical protein